MRWEVVGGRDGVVGVAGEVRKWEDEKAKEENIEKEDNGRW